MTENLETHFVRCHRDQATLRVHDLYGDNRDMLALGKDRLSISKSSRQIHLHLNAMK